MIPATPAGRIAFGIAEVVGHLRLESGLQHGTGDLTEQAARADQRHALRPGLLDQLLRDPHVQPRPGGGFASRGVLGSSVLVRQR